jgi:beta-galactosidase
MRKKVRLRDDWRFIKQDVENAQDPDHFSDDWEKVSIPHTWNAIDGANGFDYHRGACWYKRDFFVETPHEGNRVYLEFEGANSVVDVYVNGVHLGQHRGGYSTFRFDATDAVRFGKPNDLSVKVDNTVLDDVYPQMADFTFYGGIYRDVHVIVANPVHFDLLDYGSTGVYVYQDDVTDERAKLTITSKLTNDLDEEKKTRLWIEVTDAAGEPVTYTAEEIILPADTTLEVALPLVIDQPRLWRGKKDPYQYRVRCSLVSFNDTIDELTVPLGLRYFHVDADKGFFLNGEHLPLHGVSRHQDRKDMGWAITEKEQVEDMDLIKEIGATSIRLAHYQHNQYFYDLCDAEGMVVWAEIPFISVMSKTELEGLNAKQQMIELIRQNFNHPSIFFWGIQNEIQIGGDRPEVRRVVNELNELTKQEDPTRLTTQANVMFVDDKDEYNEVTDILAYNKYYGWYNGKTEDFGPWIDAFHETNPKIALGISEYGAEGIIQYQNDEPKVKDYSETYHTLYHETVWKIFEQRPFLWATYVWNMFDFGANIRDEGGVQGRNNKGLITYDRKIKKDAFYMYKAHWSDEPFIHITGKRYVDRPGETMDLKIYANVDPITLYVDGRAYTPDASEERIFHFKGLPLQEGYNHLRATAEVEGRVIEDRAFFKRVEKANETYTGPEQSGGIVDNWFDMPDLGAVNVEALEFGDDVYSTRCSIMELYDHHKTRAVMERFFGDFENHPMFRMAEGMTIDQIAEMAPEKINEQALYALNKELTRIKKDR